MALVVLGIATFFIAWLSEILVGSVEQAALHLGMSKVFVGIIIVAVIGNAAEHSTAVMAAMKNRMDLSVGIAIGSSTQVALFLTPLLVFLSYFIAPQQMDLVFTRGEVFAVVISASLVAHTASDGKSNWFSRPAPPDGIPGHGGGVFPRARLIILMCQRLEMVAAEVRAVGGKTRVQHTSRCRARSARFSRRKPGCGGSQ